MTYYQNNTPWFHPGLKSVLRSKEEAHKNKTIDPVNFKKARSEWKKAVKHAKRDYKVQLESNFNTNDSQQV